MAQKESNGLPLPAEYENVQFMHEQYGGWGDESMSAH